MAMASALEVEQIIDKLGPSLGQVLCVVLSSAAFFLEGLEVMLLCSLQSIITQGHHHYNAGFVALYTTVGAALGVVAGALCSERLGRVGVMMISYIMVGLATGAVTLLNASGPMFVLLAFLGFSVAFAQPAGLSLIHEFTPPRWRLVSFACPYVMHGAGTLAAAIIIFVLRANLEADPGFWRTLLWYSTISCIAFLALSFFFLWESPSYLADTKQLALAKDTLSYLSHTAFAKGSLEGSLEAPEAHIDFRVPSYGLPQPLASGPQAEDSDNSDNELSLTAFLQQNSHVFEIVAFTSLALSFTLYSCCYITVLALTRAGEPYEGTTPVALLLESLVVAGSVFAIGTAICSPMSRKGALVSCLVGTFVAAMSLLFIERVMGSGEDASSSMRRSMLSVGMLATVFPALGSVVAWCLTLERAPTCKRAFMVAMSLCASRVGTLLAIALNWFMVLSNSFMALIPALVLCFFAFVAVQLVPQLAEIQPPMRWRSGLRGHLSSSC